MVVVVGSGSCGGVVVGLGDTGDGGAEVGSGGGAVVVSPESEGVRDRAEQSDEE